VTSEKNWQRRKVQINCSDLTCSDIDRGGIRQEVHEFYFRSELPMLGAINSDSDYVILNDNSSHYCIRDNCGY
jgi:hypothetical protein